MSPTRWYTVAAIIGMTQPTTWLPKSFVGAVPTLSLEGPRMELDASVSPSPPPPQVELGSDHAADCVKGEIHNVLAQMRLNSRFLAIPFSSRGLLPARIDTAVAELRRRQQTHPVHGLTLGHTVGLRATCDFSVRSPCSRRIRSCGARCPSCRQCDDSEPRRTVFSGFL